MPQLGPQTRWPSISPFHLIPCSCSHAHVLILIMLSIWIPQDKRTLRPWVMLAEAAEGVQQQLMQALGGQTQQQQSTQQLNGAPTTAAPPHPPTTTTTAQAGPSTSTAAGAPASELGGAAPIPSAVPVTGPAEPQAGTSSAAPAAAEGAPCGGGAWAMRPAEPCRVVGLEYWVAQDGSGTTIARLELQLLQGPEALREYTFQVGSTIGWCGTVVRYGWCGANAAVRIGVADNLSSVLCCSGRAPCTSLAPLHPHARHPCKRTRAGMGTASCVIFMLPYTAGLLNCIMLDFLPAPPFNRGAAC